MSGQIYKQDENMLHDLGNFGFDEIHFYPSNAIDWHSFFVTLFQKAKFSKFEIFQKFASAGTMNENKIEEINSDDDLESIAANLCKLIKGKVYDKKNNGIPQHVLSIYFYKNLIRQKFVFTVTFVFGNNIPNGYISCSIGETVLSLKSTRKISPIFLEFSKIIWSCLQNKNVARSFPDFTQIGHENLQGNTDNWSFQYAESISPKELTLDIAYRWAVFLSDDVVGKIGEKIISSAPYWKIEKIPGGLLLQNSLHPAELIESNYKTTKYDVMEYYEKVFKGAN